MAVGGGCVGVNVAVGASVDVDVAVAVVLAVAVGVGVRGLHKPPAQDAPNTTAHPPQVPATGAAQKSAHWQQSVAAGVLVAVGVVVDVGVRVGGGEVGVGVWSTHRLSP